MQQGNFWSWKLFRVAGIDVRIHLTFVLLLFFLFVGGSNGVVLALYTITIFGCVLLHELGHALAARHFGIATRGITLYPIGGIAQLERMPRNPFQELIITAAGPAVNLALAVGFGLLALVLGGIGSLLGGEIPATAFFLQLVIANLALFVFNLIPAFPMDGGRILRAALAMRKPYLVATRTAAQVGQVLAVAFGVVGLLLLHNPILLLIAVFVYLSAGSELRMVEHQENQGYASPSRFFVYREDDFRPLRETVVKQFDRLRKQARHAEKPADDDDPREPRHPSKPPLVKDVPFHF